MSRTPLPPFGGDKFGRRSPEIPEYLVTCNNGYRSWELRHDRELVAPSDPDVHEFGSLVQHYVWTEGLNRARCLLSESEKASRKLRNLPACEYPTKRCACGFYAYYEVDQWSQHPASAGKFQRIHGVIEGFGRCVIGSKGFRAESAVIVGLLIPEPIDISRHWAGERSSNEAREDIVDILRAKFPSVPLFDTREALLANTPLMGRPTVVDEWEEDPEPPAQVKP
jgi:hypothetical protein